MSEVVSSPEPVPDHRSFAEIFDSACDVGVPLMTEGFASQLTPVLNRVEEQLAQLEEFQRRLMEQLGTTTEIVEKTYDLSHISSTFEKVSKYQVKLTQIRSTMTSLQSLSKNLQKRTAILRTAKMTYIGQMDAIKKKEREHDQIVAAKIVAQTPTAAVSTTAKMVVKKAGNEGKKKRKPREVEIGDAPKRNVPIEESAPVQAKTEE